jgi:pimeloyl-ACP methyl ester carboxylesterase
MSTSKTRNWAYELVPLPDDRQMEVLAYGTDLRTRALLSFTGTPSGAVPDDELADLAEARGVRLLQPLRPGYGQSSPRPGRRVVDFAEDVDAVLQHFGVTEAVCMGGSGGGPHSLAMAAALPQCRAAMVFVTVAPRDAEGLDFYDGMGLSNQEEWRLADQGEEAVRPWLEENAKHLRPRDDQPAFDDLFDDCFSEPDKKAFAEESGDLMKARFAKAVESGIEGWFGDDIALTTPWGFEPESVTTPVSFWTGKQDWFVSYRHTVWLAERVPNGDLHVFADEGHMSLRQHHLTEMMNDLFERAGW